LQGILSQQIDYSGQSQGIVSGISYLTRSFDPSAARSGDGTSFKKRIVLVDDDPGILKIYRNALTYFGFNVLATMSDGKEIVDKIDSMPIRPQVVILDERMPGMSGVEACKIIHANHADISIIFVSADSTAEKEALKAGASFFFKKPVSILQLARAIESI
jgi:DNA-binding response OmpR family regulator